MKHLYTQILAAVCCLLSYATFAQQETDGFWGIPFRCTKAQALKIYTSKKVKPAETTLNMVAFKNEIFAGEYTDLLVLKFSKNQFVLGLVNFLTETDMLTFSEFNRWQTKLTEKYGQPVWTEEKTPDYVKDFYDRQQMSVAIQSEELIRKSMWVATDRKTKSNVFIMLVLGKNKTVNIVYSDEGRGLEEFSENIKMPKDDY
jgi:hypothetical protein